MNRQAGYQFMQGFQAKEDVLSVLGAHDGRCKLVSPSKTKLHPHCFPIYHVGLSDPFIL